MCTVLCRLLPSPLHQRLMTLHAEYSLRGPCIFEILDLLLTISTAKTSRAESLVASENSQILNLVPACATAICTIVADERAVPKKKKVCVRVEKCAALVAAEAVNMPTIARWKRISISILAWEPLLDTYQVRRLFPLQGSAHIHIHQHWGRKHRRRHSQRLRERRGLYVPRRTLCRGLEHRHAPLKIQDTRRTNPSLLAFNAQHSKTGSSSTAGTGKNEEEQSWNYGLSLSA